MLSSKIDTEDYALIKKETQIVLNRLEAKLNDFVEDPFKIDLLLPKAIDVISNIAVLYQVTDNENKRAIIGSMYPEKLHFDGEKHRTTRVNEIASFIYLISSNL